MVKLPIPGGGAKIPHVTRQLSPRATIQGPACHAVCHNQAPRQSSKYIKIFKIKNKSEIIFCKFK